MSEKRLALTAQGQVRYLLKTPYRDGTTHVILEPLDFIARLAALVPKPRVNLIRYHGVLAPNANHRGEVAPLGRGRGGKPHTQAHHRSNGDQPRVDWEDKTPSERHQVMRWAQRLKRVFNIDIETCANCGGQVKVIACIEDPVVIKKILDHKQSREEGANFGSSVLPRGHHSGVFSIDQKNTTG